MTHDEPFIVQKFGVPDYRSPEQRALDEAVAPAMQRVSRLMSERVDQLFSRDHGVSVDAMRCRPADAEPVVEPTWQPAYAGPPPSGDIRLQYDGRHFARAFRKARRRKRLVDLAENLLLAAATWLDERGRRTR